MFIKLRKICPPLNTWNGRSSFRRSVFSKAAGREGLSSSLGSQTPRVPLSSRPLWPLHFTSLSCKNTDSCVTLAYPWTWKGKQATKMIRGQIWPRSLVRRGELRIRGPACCFLLSGLCDGHEATLSWLHHELATIPTTKWIADFLKKGILP